MIDLRKSAELNGMEPMELYSWFKRYPRSNKRVICYCDICGIEREVSYSYFNSDCDRCYLCSSKDPIINKKRSEGRINFFVDQENRNAVRDWMNEYWLHQENHDEQSNRKIEYWSHQENRDERSIISTKYFSHQENRVSMSVIKQGILYDEWEDFVYNKNDGRRSPESKQWRFDIFERDNYTCQLCYQHNGDINAHHIRKWSEYPELRYDINNGITLCVDCHIETYNKEDEYIDFLQKRLNQKVYIG